MARTGRGGQRRRRAEQRAPVRVAAIVRLARWRLPRRWWWHGAPVTQASRADRRGGRRRAPRGRRTRLQARQHRSAHDAGHSARTLYAGAPEPWRTPRKKRRRPTVTRRARGGVIARGKG
jgi:hypothetical protein